MPKPTSEEKRREWAEKIRAQKESGLSIEKWCREHQIKSSVFYYWKDTLLSRAALTRSSFTEIPSSAESSFSIEFRKCHIRFSRFCPMTLQSCLVVLRETLC